MLDVRKGGAETRTTDKVLSPRTIGIGLLVGLYLFIGVPNAFASDEEEGNVIALHDRSSPQFVKECTSCHTEILTQQSLDPFVSTAHVVMHQVVPGEEDDDKCVFCHLTVNIVQKLAGNLRRHVDVELCTFCHGPSGPPALTQFYQIEPAVTLLDGARLYELTCSGCHRDLARSEVEGESADEIQEKIEEDEGGMGPLSNFLSAAQIQAIADALAKDNRDYEEDD